MDTQTPTTTRPTIKLNIQTTNHPLHQSADKKERDDEPSANADPSLATVVAAAVATLPPLAPLPAPSTTSAVASSTTMVRVAPSSPLSPAPNYIGSHNIGQLRLNTGHRPSSSHIDPSIYANTSGLNVPGLLFPRAFASASGSDLSGSGSKAPAPVTNRSPPLVNISSQRPLRISQATLQFLVLGSEGVGKTSLLTRLQNHCVTLVNTDRAPGQHNRTTGPDLHRLACGNIEGIDIGGQDSCLRIAQAYCDVVNCYVLMFDITRMETFLMVRYWLNFIEEKRVKNEQSDPDAPKPCIMLVGNKRDLPANKRRVSANLARNLAMANQAEYVEISAKMDITLDHILKSLESKYKSN